MKFKLGLFVLLWLFTSLSVAAEKTVIRIGLLAFGTLEWELGVLKNEPAMETADYQIQPQVFASPQAAEVALQAGAVDVIVTDWIWTSRMRSTGTDVTFYPYSNTAGGLVVAEKSPLKSIKDLAGKRLGIAGGELDKNWLLLQALASGEKINLQGTKKVFGAPPLLNQQMQQGRLDALLTYWHFAARLESQGYRQLIDGKGILAGLGIKEEVPSLGYVFKQSWAAEHKMALTHFLNASHQAKEKLCTVDDAWQKIGALLDTSDVATQAKLRERYCAGRVTQWGSAAQLQAAKQIYALLHKLSQSKLTGAETIQPGTFWTLN